MAATAPPREAIKQDDGSYMQALEDGSTMRWTRRPDGTWRKPEHVRAGWVGELEQKAYVSKGAAQEQQRQATMQAYVDAPRQIPGAPPDTGAAQAKSQASKKNERKKEKRREKAEEQDELRLVEADKGAVQSTAAVEDMAAAGKSEKAIQKKLKQIEELEKKQKDGEALNEDQLAKIEQKSVLKAELKAVLAGEPLPAPVVETPQVSEPAKAPKAAPAPVAEVAKPAPAASPKTAPAPAPAPVAAAEPEPAAEAAAPKSRKAIEKKLKQIAQIEEKEKAGETLNDDQREKLASKKQLKAELASC